MIYKGWEHMAEESKKTRIKVECEVMIPFAGKATVVVEVEVDLTTGKASVPGRTEAERIACASLAELPLDGTFTLHITQSPAEELYRVKNM